MRVVSIVAVGLCVVGVATRAAAQPAPSSSLTLKDALLRARAVAPTLAAARARADAAHEARARAGRLLNPLIELRSENWASGAPGGLPLDVFATVTQTVELGDKRGARRGLAEAAVVGAEAAAGLGWRDVSAAVAAEYLSALRAGEHTASLDRYAARLREALRVLSRRVEVGTAPEAELLKLRAEDARVAIALARMRVTAMRAAAALEARLDTAVTVGSLRRPEPPTLPPSGALPEAHPELRAAEGALQSARAAARFEHARGRPDIGVNGGVKRTSGYNTGVVALTVALPVFDANTVARVVADGQARAAELERAAVERRLRGARDAAAATASTLNDKAAEVAQTLVAPAIGARDAARAAFDAGALDVMRLVDAERLADDASGIAIDLAIDAIAAAIEARLAAGLEPLP